MYDVKSGTVIILKNDYEVKTMLEALCLGWHALDEKLSTLPRGDRLSESIRQNFRNAQSRIEYLFADLGGEFETGELGRKPINPL